MLTQCRNRNRNRNRNEDMTVPFAIVAKLVTLGGLKKACNMCNVVWCGRRGTFDILARLMKLRKSFCVTRAKLLQGFQKMT